MDKYGTIRSLLKDDAVKEALEKLEEIAKVNRWKKEEKEVVLISASLSRVNNDSIFSTKEEENVSRSTIISRIFDLTSRLEKKEKESSSQAESTSLMFTEEKILELVKTAIILIELEKIKEEFELLEWEEKNVALDKLYKFSAHTTFKLSWEVFSFLEDVTEYTVQRNPDVAFTVYSLISSYFPYFERGEDKKYETTAFQCIHIAFNIFYDATLKLKNLRPSIYGLQILKRLYLKSKERQNITVLNEIRNTYDILESHLKRYDSKDSKKTELIDAKELLKIFKDDLDSNSLSYPLMPKKFLDLVEV